MNTKKENNLAYWFAEGTKIFKEWFDDKSNQMLWGAFNCCAAAIVEFDHQHKDARTRMLQSLAWKWAWATGECPLERWQKSGYFDENFYEKIAGLN